MVIMRVGNTAKVMAVMAALLLGQPYSLRPRGIPDSPSLPQGFMGSVDDLITADPFSISRAKSNEGEDHRTIKPPSGCELTSIKGKGWKKGEEMPLFKTKGVGDESVRHVFVAIHGKLRDGGHYWKTMVDAIELEDKHRGKHSRRWRNEHNSEGQDDDEDEGEGDDDGNDNKRDERKDYWQRNKLKHSRDSKDTKDDRDSKQKSGKESNGKESNSKDAKDKKKHNHGNHKHKQPGALVVAPQFFSKKYNSGQYSKQQLAWGDVNAWQSGSAAVHPHHTDLTSIDALDAIVAEFSNASKYPKVTNITVIGHGGGGQLVQRYAAIATEPARSRVHVRYIHGDASSCAYFTKDRPGDKDKDIPSKKKCGLYNIWRYGYDDFTGSHRKAKEPQDYFAQYISRDVVSIVGYKDTAHSGDQSCMAQMQGGTKRRDRNLIWFRYVNTLARTREDVDGFPGEFDGSIPDWSDVSNHTIAMRLVVVKDAAHDLAQLLKWDAGRSALFSDGDVEPGWRPEKKKDKKPKDDKPKDGNPKDENPKKSHHDKEKD